MSPQGVLQVEGYFPFTESNVNFSYKYVYRFTDWKIVGINSSRPVRACERD